MHTKLRLWLGGVALFGLALLPVTVWAQSSFSNAQVEEIRQNCLAAQVTLQRLQHSDVAIRINRGQAYDVLLTKLMTPFNARVALNQVDKAPALAEKTKAMTALVAQFKRDYVQYEDALSSTLKITCRDRPVAFYDSLAQTRLLRMQVADDVRQIQIETKAYLQQVQMLEKELAEVQP